MQIALPPINLLHLPTEPALPSDRNGHQEASAHPRHRRSIDSSPPNNQEVVQEVVPNTNSSKGGYVEVNVNPDPNKGIGVGEKAPEPVNSDSNINVDPVTQEISGAFKTVKEEASIFLKKKFAEMAAQAATPAEKEKWNIDPDNTYLITYDYNTTGEKPYPAKIIKRISLTEALITNAQDTPTGAGYQVPFYAGGPEVIVKPELETHTPGVFNFGSRFNPYTEKADITHTYQGIYIESSEEPAPVYNGGNQSAITPDEFKKLIWKADYQKPYDQFLNEFWSNHEKKYPLLAKSSLVKAAMSQHQEQSLSKEGRDLVMRASGLAGNQASWPDIKLEDLQKNPPKDPDIEVGMLKVGNFQSTDLMYITDKKVRFDANGKKLPPLTLLHIPGNSSPIHTFNGQTEMKAWFAEQMADPVKREAMAGHFPLKDKPNGYAQAGIDETLAGLGTWPEKRETPGGLLSYDHRAFSGFWDPQDFIKAEPSHSPFDEITTRQKDRSYSDAAVDITSDRDVIKNNIISGLEKAAKAALFLTPLAFVMPEVALTLDAFYLASGITEAGIGIDDKVHGKPTGNQRIIFGFFNAAIAVLPHIAKTGKSGEEAAASEIKPGEESKPNELNPEHEPPAEIEAEGDAPTVEVKMGGPMKNLKIVGNEVHTFEDTYKAGRRLNIVAHGSKPYRPGTFFGEDSKVVIDGKGYSPKKLIALLKSKGIDPETYDSVRLIVCHSGEGRGSSFAAKFQKEINKPVKAFEGGVFTNFGSTTLKNYRDKYVTQIMASNPKITRQEAERIAEAKLQADHNDYSVTKINKNDGQPTTINSAPPGEPPKYEDSTVEYKPVYFPPKQP